MTSFDFRRQGNYKHSGFCNILNVQRDFVIYKYVLENDT